MSSSGSPWPQLTDYEETRRRFAWAVEWRRLDGLPDRRGLNIAHEAIDRHVLAGRGGQLALRFLPRHGEPLELTYEELGRRTNRFATVIDRLRTEDAPTVATVTGRIPELHIAALGALKAGAIVAPLFAGSSPDDVRERIVLGSIEILVVTPETFRHRVNPILDRIPSVRHVLVAGADELETDDPRVHSLDRLMAEARDEWLIPSTVPQAPALLHFTTGTTGPPKGVLHTHEAVVMHHTSSTYALDLQPGDVFWCSAEPGWATATSYGIIAPLTHGVTAVVDEGDFDPGQWSAIVERHRVGVWYTGPSAIRALRDAGEDAVQAGDLSSLRLVASAGGPLDAATVRWARDALDAPVLDTWWQTETGAIMIANYRDEPIRPGSMGRPLPGIDATILERGADGRLVLDDEGRPVEVTDPQTVGELVLRSGWPSMFRGYLDRPDRYADAFVDGWYRSGDLARRDADGYFWFAGRSDADRQPTGHLMGPHEVEQALADHPAVVEASEPATVRSLDPGTTGRPGP